MKIRNSMMIIIIIVCVQVGFVGYFTLASLTKLQESTHQIDDRTIPSLAALNEIKFSILRVVSSTNEYLLVSGQSGTEDELSLIAEGKKEYNDAFGTYQSLAYVYFPDEIGLAKNIQEKTNRLFSTSDEIIKSEKTLTQSDLQVLRKELEEKEGDALEAIQIALKSERNELSEAKENLAERYNSIFYMDAVMVVAIISFTTASGVLFSKSVSGKIDGLIAELGKIKKDQDKSS
ncbi:MAG: hypothetical protein EPO63_07665 [Candidatus Nitrosotenuis sp.]|nr:MAG: hypothetical protein EPO63_07665 [Candidatus Nitrosotenuis sp.]